MPKIVINEIDKTKAGTTEYSNFSVVVPGFLGIKGEAYEQKVAAGEAVAAFDENGVYECSSQSDFEDKVGLSNWTFEVDRTVKSPIAPTISLIVALDTSKAPTEAVGVSEEPESGETGEGEGEDEGVATLPEDEVTDDISRILNGFISSVDEALEVPVWTFWDREVYYLALTAFETKDAQLVAEAKKATINISDKFSLYYANEVAGQEPGYLKYALDNGNVLSFKHAVGSDTDTTTKLPKVEAGPTGCDGQDLVYYSLKAYSENTYYIINDNPKEVASGIATGLAGTVAGSIRQDTSCPAGLDGYSVKDRIVHYGNQIAYELLGMGYTILYKKMTKEYIETLVTTDEGFIYDNNTPVTDLQTLLETVYNKALTEGKITREEPVSQDIAELPYECSAVSQLDDIDFWECLKDKSVYDFRYIITGTMDHGAIANQRIIAIAEHKRDTPETGRGDCVALIDVDRSCYTGAGKTNQAAAIPYIAQFASNFNSKYAAIFAPSVTYTMPEIPAYGKNRTFPGYFHYLACAARSADNYSEWYANAGFTRGVGKYSIESTGCKFGEVAIQALEPRFKTATKNGVVTTNAAGNKVTEPVTVNTAVNLVVKIKNSYYLWGNRTCHELGTEGAEGGNLIASHFLNIRQLCSTIKKQVYTACRRLTFDPNSQVLWINFCSLIEPTLAKMKGDQGVKDYKILPGKTTEKGTLAAKIRIVPIEAVEDFYIDLFLEDSLSGTDVSVDE